MNKCNLIGDLLPLYSEKLLSEDSVRVVEHHLARCESCAKKAKQLLSPEPELPEKTTLSPETDVLKKTKQKFNLKTALITTASVILSAVIVFFGVFGSVVAIRKREAAERKRQERLAQLTLLLDSCRFGALEQSLVKHDPIKIGYAPCDDYELVSSLPRGMRTYKMFLPNLIEFEMYEPNYWGYTAKDYLESAYVSVKSDTALAEIAKNAAATTGSLYEEDLRESYNDLYRYCASRWSKDYYANIAKYVLEYSFDGLTAESPIDQLHTAFAVSGMRGYFVEKYGWSMSNKYYPIEYYPITGSLNGYALFLQMGLRDNRYPGHWEIYLQSGSAVWSLEFSVRNTKEHSFVSNIANMTVFLSHIRLE